MTRERRTKLLLAGYASDLAMVTPLLAVPRADTTVVDEDGFETELPEAVDVVVFALSLGATSSTPLRIVCDRIHHRVAARQKYLLPVGDVDLDARRFPEFADLPKTTITDLNRLLSAHSKS